MAQRQQRSRELEGLYEAALAITAELSLDKVLKKIVETARNLVDARYAALVVLGEDGATEHFVAAGMTPDEIARVGDPPHGRGLLGLIMRGEHILRLPDVVSHPTATGFPPHHPRMTSFLGAPLTDRGRVVGSLYLANKVGAKEFTPEDEDLIKMLAAQAAVAVKNARLFALTDEALRQKVEELQAQQHNLQAIVDQMPEGVVILDPSAEKVMLANRVAQTLLGVDGESEHLEGVLAAFRQVARPDGAPMPREETPMYRAVGKGEVVTGEQVSLMRADGGYFAALVSAATLYDPEGRVVGGIVIFQDITALTELDRLKDELISIISHELRNPLTAIRGRAQLMLRAARRTPGRSEDVVALEAIDGQVEKLADMVRELLDVSQMRLGILELNRAPTDLVALLSQSVEQFGAADERHTLRFETGLESLTGEWDGARLEQVVFNLLENAAKYSPQGRTITVRLAEESGAPARPHEHGLGTPGSAAFAPPSNQRRWALVAISDEGIGIPKEAQSHLFDRFYRAANAKGRTETGLGLGLYVCHEIIVQHGGSIWVESAEGQGTTIYFALPVQ